MWKWAPPMARTSSPPASLTMSGAKPLLVKEGLVAALDEVSYTNLNLTVSGGAGFRVTGLSRAAFASATGVDATGVKALSVALADPSAKISVVPDVSAAVAAEGVFSAAICTVPEANDDLLDAFEAIKVSAADGVFLGKVTKEPPAGGFVRYVATWSHSGTAILFR